MISETPPWLHVIHLLVHADWGGCEWACRHVCHYLEDVRHTVIVLGRPTTMSRVLEKTGARVEHLDLMRGSRRRRVQGLHTAFQRVGRTDGTLIWHGMAELTGILHALPAGCGPVFIHGGNPAYGMSRVTDWRFLLAERWRYPHRHHPAYICCSRYVADSFERSRYLRRFPRHVVLNGVEPLPEEAVHVPKQLDMAQDEIVIGMLARLDAIKDHATLLRAFALVRARAPRARLELAGDGDQAASLRRLAEELGLGGTVEFLGTVSNVYERLPRWDLFAYATTEQEGFGLALAESLMCALPTVVTDVGPVREVCGEASHGAVEYVPLGDPAALAAALVALVPDLARRQALSRAARERALSELSAPVFARRYGDLLAEEVNIRREVAA